MQFPTDREIQERFDDLPRAVQDAIQSADMASALQAVGAGHGLHVDQLGSLEDEALLVMLGFSNPAAFPERVRASLGVDDNTSTSIAAEVSERLFMPIRAAMREYMEERLKRAEEQKTRGIELPTRSVKTGFEHSVSTAPAPTQPPPSTDIPETGGGKTIMPSSTQPVLHPAEAMLAKPTVTTPAITDFSAPGALQTPKTTAIKQYVVDPYHEPVE